MSAIERSWSATPEELHAAQQPRGVFYRPMAPQPVLVDGRTYEWPRPSAYDARRPSQHYLSSLSWGRNTRWNGELGTAPLPVAFRHCPHARVGTLLFVDEGRPLLVLALRAVLRDDTWHWAFDWERVPATRERRLYCSPAELARFQRRPAGTFSRVVRELGPDTIYSEVPSWLKVPASARRERGWLIPDLGGQVRSPFGQPGQQLLAVPKAAPGGKSGSAAVTITITEEGLEKRGGQWRWVVGWKQTAQPQAQR